MVNTDNSACTHCFHHLMACVDRIRMLLQNIHNHVIYQTIRCLNSTTLRILTTVSTSNPVPKIIKNWNVDGKVTVGKLNYRTAVYIVTQYLISHTFPTHCEHCYILRLNTVIYCVSKNWGKNHLQSKYTFYDQDHIQWISNVYLSYTTRKLNHRSWHKTPHMAMKIYGRMFSKCGSLCHTHNLNDSHNNIKWSTIITFNCHYLLTQPHSTLTHLSHVGKVFKTIMAENRLLHSSCCTIGDLASVVSLAQK